MLVLVVTVVWVMMVAVVLVLITKGRVLGDAYQCCCCEAG